MMASNRSIGCVFVATTSWWLVKIQVIVGREMQGHQQEWQNDGMYQHTQTSYSTLSMH